MGSEILFHVQFTLTGQFLDADWCMRNLQQLHAEQRCLNTTHTQLCYIARYYMKPHVIWRVD
jgi:hypothetical protein